MSSSKSTRHHGSVPSDALGFFGMPAQLTPRGSAYLMPPTTIIDGSSRSRRSGKPLQPASANGGAIYEDAARQAAPARVKAGRRAGTSRQPLLTVSADTTVLMPGGLTERPITAGSELS